MRRNARVGRLDRGGYEGELDVVALHPEQRKFVHIETSMDALSWKDREAKFKKKLDCGRRFARDLFKGMSLPEHLQQIVLLESGAKGKVSQIGDGEVKQVTQLMKEIKNALKNESDKNAVVPERFVILRSLQYAEYYWR